MADNILFSPALLLIQLVGMVAFYLYYTHRNKKAAKAYWQKVNQEKTI
jgi:hypothetical protein